MDARVEVAGGASDSRYWPLHQAAAPQRGSTSPRRCSLGVSFPIRDHIRSVSFSLFVSPHALHLLALFLHRGSPIPVRRGGVQVGLEEVQRDGQDNGRVLLCGDLAHGLEESQLQCCRALQPVCGLPEALGGLVLALRRYDLGPPLALALGLAGHRPLHLRGDLDVLDLNHAHLYPPRLSLLVYYPLELLVYSFSVGQEVVEILLTEDASEGGLAYLAGGQDVVLYLYDALVGVHHPEVDHRGYAGGDIVASDEVLGRNIQGDGPQFDLNHLVHQRDQDEEARSFGSPLHPTEPEDDPPLVLLDYLDGARQDEQDNRNHRYQHYGRKPYSNRLQQAQAHVHERHSFRLNFFRPS